MAALPVARPGRQTKMSSPNTRWTSQTCSGGLPSESTRMRAWPGCCSQTRAPTIANRPPPPICVPRGVLRSASAQVKGKVDERTHLLARRLKVDPLLVEELQASKGASVGSACRARAPAVSGSRRQRQAHLEAVDEHSPAERAAAAGQRVGLYCVAREGEEAGRSPYRGDGGRHGRRRGAASVVPALPVVAANRHHPFSTCPSPLPPRPRTAAPGGPTAAADRHRRVHSSRRLHQQSQQLAADVGPVTPVRPASPLSLPALGHLRPPALLAHDHRLPSAAST